MDEWRELFNAIAQMKPAMLFKDIRFVHVASSNMLQLTLSSALECKRVMIRAMIGAYYNTEHAMRQTYNWDDAHSKRDETHRSIQMVSRGFCRLLRSIHNIHCVQSQETTRLPGNYTCKKNAASRLLQNNSSGQSGLLSVVCYIAHAH